MTKTAETIDTAAEILRLREENAEIKKMLTAAAPVIEDAWALKVFEKSKSYLIGWITFGGVTAIFAGIIIFSEAWNYTKGLVDDSLKAEMKANLHNYIQSEVKTQSRGAIQSEVTKQIREHFRNNPQEVTEVERTVIAGIFIEKTKSGTSVLQSASSAPASHAVVDLSPQMPAVRNEGQEGAGVGFVVSAALEYQIFKDTGKTVQLSPRGIYNLAREIEHTSGSDSGAQVRDAIKAVAKTGAVLESDWPYKAGQFAQKRPAAFDRFKKYKIESYFRMSGTVEEIKGALRSTGPVVGGIEIFASMDNAEVIKSGIIPLPKPGESQVGGLAILIVGYDDGQKRFKIQNFWGTDWGDKGFGYVPYAYFTSSLSSDFWSIAHVGPEADGR